MAVMVYRIPETPVIVATLGGEISPQSVNELSAHSAEAASDIEGIVFRIINASAVLSSFSDMYQAMRAARHDAPGSMSDPRFRLILVGRSRWARLARSFMQHRQIDIPIFLTVEDAITFVHMHLQARTE